MLPPKGSDSIGIPQKPARFPVRFHLKTDIRLVVFPDGSDGKESALSVRGLGATREDPLEKGMATHSRVLAWRIPWTEEPDRL